MQSPIRTITATAGITTALAFTVAPAAYADPDPSCAELSENLRRLCESMDDAERVWTEEANKNSSLGDAVGDWFSANAGIICLVIGIAAAIAITITIRKGNAEDREKAAAARDARGRALAAADQARRQAEAEAAALAQAPARETYDPLQLGLPAPAAHVPQVAAAPTNPEDLARYAALGAVVPWTPGTALASVTTRSGDDAPARRAFAEACELGGLGETDPETGTFAPAASVVRVEPAADEGDAALVIRPASVMTGGEQIDRVRTLLERTARVRHAGPAVRAHATGEWIVVLSNRDLTALEQQTAAPGVAVDSDVDEDW
ncbi:hypothetical protein ACFWXB_16180 [Tsukamurella tyrosinosolvens]|uniref:hypothetical protein n=1 Tax=Tsukamurella tyrosinosolvens TaxID=57704 RepID=UPI0036B33F8E